MTDDRTTTLNLPKPSPANLLTEDLLRLRDALDLIDAAINDKADAQDIADQLSTLIGGAPGVLDTLKELADAIGNNPNFATTIATQIASLQASLSSLAATGVSYNNAASGISANTVQEAIDYLKNIAGGGSGGSQASYTRQKFTATAGQTTFTTSGYSVGYIEVYLNGVLLDITDYTASNGTTVVLASGAAAGDELVTVALDSFNIANLLRVISANASATSNAITLNGDGSMGMSGGPVAIRDITSAGGEASDWPVPSLSIASFDDFPGNTMLGFLLKNDPKYVTDGSLWNFRLWDSGSAVVSSSSTDLTLTGPGALTLGAGNGNRFKIDTSGRVTMSYQPSFLAYSTGFSHAGGWLKISGNMNQTNHNVGPNYNTSNGRFTAPVSGRYVFFAGGWASSNSNGERYAFNAQVNGGTQNYIAGGNYSNGDTPLGSYSVCYNLTAGDYVELSMFSAVATTVGGNPHYAFFSGYLLG